MLSWTAVSSPTLVSAATIFVVVVVVVIVCISVVAIVVRSITGRVSVREVVSGAGNSVPGRRAEATTDGVRNVVHVLLSQVIAISGHNGVWSARIVHNNIINTYMAFMVAGELQLIGTYLDPLSLKRKQLLRMGSRHRILVCNSMRDYFWLSNISLEYYF